MGIQQKSKWIWLLLLLASCTEPENGLNSLVAITPVEAGRECLYGGSKVESGIDTNDNGTLDADEVTSTSYICHGSDGLNSLVDITPIAAGPTCMAGGSLIQSGIDANGNGQLETGEVSASATICNGVNGLNTVVEQENLTAGGGCSTGGVKISYGLDENYNNELDADEILDSFIICHGDPGAGGLNSLINLKELEPNEDCAAGGVVIESGLDTNSDGQLDESEVTATQMLCSPSTADEKILKQVAADSIINILKDLGLEINTGTNPPSIENTYLLSPNILINSNRTQDNIGSQFLDLKVQALEQDNENLTIKIIQEQGGGVGNAQGGFIIGNDSKFTILIDVVTVYEQMQDSARALFAYSGQLTDSGISNFQTSLSLTDDYGDPNNRFIEIGDSRIFEDGDGFSPIIDEDLSGQRIAPSIAKMEQLLLNHQSK